MELNRDFENASKLLNLKRKNFCKPKSSDLPIGDPNPEWKGLLSRSRCPLALIMSPMTPPRPRQPPAFFFLLFDESFLFLVWMPSFFIVSGRFTCNSRRQQFAKFRIYATKERFVARDYPAAHY